MANYASSPNGLPPNHDIWGVLLSPGGSSQVYGLHLGVLADACCTLQPCCKPSPRAPSACSRYGGLGCAGSDVQSIIGKGWIERVRAVLPPAGWSAGWRCDPCTPQLSKDSACPPPSIRFQFVLIELGLACRSSRWRPLVLDRAWRCRSPLDFNWF